MVRSDLNFSQVSLSAVKAMHHNTYTASQKFYEPS